MEEKTFWNKPNLYAEREWEIGLKGENYRCVFDFCFLHTCACELLCFLSALISSIENFFLFNVLAFGVKSFPGGSDGQRICQQCKRPGEGNGNPLQYSYLENSMDIGAWWAAVHGVTKGWNMTEWLILICSKESFYSSFVCFAAFISSGDGVGKEKQWNCTV